MGEKNNAGIEQELQGIRNSKSCFTETLTETPAEIVTGALFGNRSVRPRFLRNPQGAREEPTRQKVRLEATPDSSPEECEIKRIPLKR